MQFIYDDGGRKNAGFKGNCGDCVTRAITIATGLPYREVYDSLAHAAQEYGENRRDKVARRIRSKGASPRNGVHRKIYEPFLKKIGWKWVPTMKIGTGCMVHLHDGELPMGRLIVRLSGHLVAVIDGVIHDTYDPQRNNLIMEDGFTRVMRRCVYGYFIKQ